MMLFHKYGYYLQTIHYTITDVSVLFEAIDM